jgi:superfamily II DNA or RNA helicase/Flp pilus assembly protein TadD
MKRDKRERHRLKRAQKRKQKVRHEARVAETVARQERALSAEWEAQTLLRAGRVKEALAAASRAAELAPRDEGIVGLYARAAERARALDHRRRAYELLAQLGQPSAPLLITLADLYVATGEARRARETLERARAVLPVRMKDRQRWIAFLHHVEERCARAIRASEPGESTLPLFAEQPAEPAAAPTAAASTQAVEENEVAPAPALPFEIPLTLSLRLEGLTSLGANGWSRPEDVELSLLAAEIRETESFDRLFAVERAQGLLRLSHQEETARKVLSLLLGRALLADEVGLGKTIEAGLVLSEYLIRGRVERALILTPPSLVAQWREELAAKFGIETRTTEESAFRADPERFWSASGVVIASLATARLAPHRDVVVDRTWDLIVIDEAHVAKNARTQSHALASRLRSRFLLLLTATPIENDVEELYNLVSLIRPGHLGGRADFLRRYRGGKGRISEAARREVTGLLAEVMVRNTRALSGVRLPPRFARTVLVRPHASEGELYEHLVAALRGLGAGGRTRLLLSVLLQEAGSSPYAVRATLEKVAADDDLAPAARTALAPAVDCAAREPETGKGQALLRALSEGEGPTVVFTRFRATLAFLFDLLAKHGVACERIDGEVPVAARHEAIVRCRDGAGVLLSTDVGSEGLNLQFCRRIVNFDLPWNPMRIEQRIGRIHRIGQEHPVEVVNLCLAGSIEERILRILDERINLFELVVGEVETILGYLEEEGEFGDLMLDAFAEAEEERREKRLTSIADALAAARLRYQNVKSFDEAFFRNELGV